MSVPANDLGGGVEADICGRFIVEESISNNKFTTLLTSTPPPRSLYRLLFHSCGEIIARRAESAVGEAESAITWNKEASPGLALKLL